MLEDSDSPFNINEKKVMINNLQNENTKLKNNIDLEIEKYNILKIHQLKNQELFENIKNDLLKFRNFGKKSLTELEDLVQSKNLQFGMNVAKYKLDKD